MHDSTKQMLRWFDASHLPTDLADVVAPFGILAHELVDEQGGKGLAGAEATAGLRKLVEAKDCFVRAAIARREAGPPAER